MGARIKMGPVGAHLAVGAKGRAGISGAGGIGAVCVFGAIFGALVEVEAHPEHEHLLGEEI